MNDKIVLGIDLGTTNSVASYWDGMNYNLIKNKDSYLFPSIIKFEKHGKLVSKDYTSDVIRNFKRVVGKSTKNIDTLKLISDLNYNVNIENDIILFFNEFENKNYSIEELNSLILKKIKETAEKQLKCEIYDVVITIPAHFDQIQRESILVSSKISQLNCIRLVNEPTAAAISYGLNLHDDVNILVFDLGGGTFDLSVLNVDEGVLEVINTYGDNLLGGEDFTKLLIKDVLDKFRNENKLNNLNENSYNKNYHILREKCEQIKCNIKEHNSFLIKDFYEDGDNKIDLEYSNSSDNIFNIFTPLFEKINLYLQKILSLCDMKKNEIDHIILVGGATKLTKIKFIIESFFQKQSICTIDPDLVVSIGASILGFTINNPHDAFSSNLALVDILQLSIGIESDNGVMTKIINKGEKIPIKKCKYFTTEEDNQNEVEIKIFQGERINTNDNLLIGSFKLNNLQLKPKGNVIIKVEINVDNNGIININASEKGYDNNSFIKIENSSTIYDEEKIKKIINEGEKYENLDNIKYKLRQKYFIIQNHIENLKYNCNDNVYINLNESDKIDLNQFINKLNDKVNDLISPIKFIFDKNYEYNDVNLDTLENILVNLKKLIKINEKRYSSMIAIYDNDTKNLKTFNSVSSVNNISFESNSDYNNFITDKISKLLDKVKNDNNISIYSKNLIFTTINNITYKLQSISLDEDLYNEYINSLNNNMQFLLSNDSELINKYGNLDILKKIVEKYNVNLQITQELENIDIFNIIYQISLDKDINLNNI